MKRTLTLFAFLLLCALPYAARAQDKPETPPIQVGNAFPNITTMAEYDAPTEAGIGALLPGANRLWFVSYVAHKRGAGTGLFWVDETMRRHKHPASVVGTYTNRYIHTPTNLAFLGPHVIDTKGNVRTIEALKSYRLTSTMDHLTDPNNKVYLLAMEGELFEVDVKTLVAQQLFNLVKELGITFKQGKEHFKSGYTAHGCAVVANNSYYEADYLGEQEAGRLTEGDGKKWTIIEKKPFVEVAGKSLSGGGIGNPIFATRFLMDLHGIFYELPAQIYGGRILPIRPIANHLRLVPAFCYGAACL